MSITTSLREALDVIQYHDANSDYTIDSRTFYLWAEWPHYKVLTEKYGETADSNGDEIITVSELMEAQRILHSEFPPISADDRRIANGITNLFSRDMDSSGRLQAVGDLSAAADEIGDEAADLLSPIFFAAYIKSSCLCSNDQPMSAALEAAIVNIGSSAVFYLNDVLLNSNSVAQVYAAALLGEIGDERGIDPLVALSLEKPCSREFTIPALIQIGDDAVERAVSSSINGLERADTEEDLERNVTFLEALVLEEDKADGVALGRLFDYITNPANDPTTQVVITVSIALAATQTANPEIVAAIREKLEAISVDQNCSEQLRNIATSVLTLLPAE